MRTLLAKIFLLLFCWIMAVGCLDLKQPAVEIDYYTLEYTPPVIAERPTLPVVLQVLPLGCATLYQSTQMMYRPAPYKREAFVYHRWRTGPGQIVTAGLARDFQHSALFEAVVPTGSHAPATHRLEGTVEEFYARSENDSWLAILTLSITVTAVSDEHVRRPVVLQQQFSMSQTCPAKTPQGMSQGLSTAMQKLSAEIIVTVHDALLRYAESK
jgi:ABC-type uncharacterized transport system auxiliary subunit